MVSFILPCPVIKMNRKLHLNPDRTTNDPLPSGLKVLVTLPGKETGRAEMLMESGEKTECIVEVCSL